MMEKHHILVSFKFYSQLIYHTSMFWKCISTYWKCNLIPRYTVSIYSFQFPTLQQLGEDLVTVLDFLHVKYVIGIGEGAGANVLARFGLAYPARVLGLILINCTGSATSVLDSFKNKVINIYYTQYYIALSILNYLHTTNTSFSAAHLIVPPLLSWSFSFDMKIWWNVFQQQYLVE